MEQIKIINNKFGNIRSLIDQFEKNSKGSDNYIPDPKNYEIEIRFRQYSTVRGITFKAFNDFKDKYKDNLIDQINSQDEIVTLKGTHDTFRSEFYKDKKVEILKKQIYHRDLHQGDQDNYGMLMAISYERPIETEELKDELMKIKQSIFIRNKERYVYNIEGFIIDLTKVKESKDTIYELEINIDLFKLDESIKLNRFDKFIDTIDKFLDKIFLLINGGNYFYTRNKYFEIIKNVNSKLIPQLKNEITISNKPLFQPRNLKIDDLMYGGLIGSNEIYTVTPKADGLRRILFSENGNIWLVYPPYDVSFYLKANKGVLNDFILDGELVEYNEILNENGIVISPKKLVYLVFDCLYDNEIGKLIQSYPLEDRIKTASKFVAELQKVKNLKFECQTKSFMPFKTSNELFLLMDTLTKTNFPYNIDGYIFTPSYMPYDVNISHVSLENRVLTKQPDICKWKPVEEITIDFLVKDNKLYSYNQLNNQMELFTGTSLKPFNGDYESNEDIPDETIVEFYWDFDKNKFIKKKYRTDKVKPNRKEFAIDNWKLIHLPITIETLKGESLALLRKYHNDIKRNLFNECIQLKAKTLLDIGSGRGGDINKWFNFEKIICVEPNIDNIKELIIRINEMFNQLDTIVISDISELNLIHRAIERNDKIIIIYTGGENYDLITKSVNIFISNKVDIVSSMLSLSFFNGESLQNLIKTITMNIKPSGRFIFLTINSRAIKEFFIKSSFKQYDKLEQTKDLSNNFLYNINYVDNKIFIDIKGTIVEHQEEYLVDIDYIMSQFTNFKLEKHNMTTKNDIILNKYEIFLNSLYSYGYFDPK